MVVDLPSNYNAILGRLILHELKVATSIYNYYIKFPALYETEIIRGDQVKARACNVNLPQPRINMLNDRQNDRAREAMLKRPIVVDLSKIGIIEKYRKRPTNDHLSFVEEKANPYSYLRVLVVSMPIARVTISWVLVDTGSTLNILFTSTLKWMGIPANFLRPYPNMVLELSGALTTVNGSIKLTVEAKLNLDEPS